MLDATVTVGKYLLDKARTNPGKTLGYSVAAGTAIVGPVMLPLVGFSAIGPVSGTLAAAWQAGQGSVAAGSIFSLLQSAAMTGIATKVSFGTGVAIAASTSAWDQLKERVRMGGKVEIVRKSEE